MWAAECFHHHHAQQSSSSAPCSPPLATLRHNTEAAWAAASLRTCRVIAPSPCRATALPCIGHIARQHTSCTPLAALPSSGSKTSVHIASKDGQTCRQLCTPAECLHPAQTCPSPALDTLWRSTDKQAKPPACKCPHHFSNHNCCPPLLSAGHQHRSHCGAAQDQDGPLRRAAAQSLQRSQSAGARQWHRHHVGAQHRNTPRQDAGAQGEARKFGQLVDQV